MRCIFIIYLRIFIVRCKRIACNIRKNILVIVERCLWPRGNNTEMVLQSSAGAMLARGAKRIANYTTR